MPRFDPITGRVIPDDPNQRMAYGVPQQVSLEGTPGAPRQPYNLGGYGGGFGLDLSRTGLLTPSPPSQKPLPGAPGVAPVDPNPPASYPSAGFQPNPMPSIWDTWTGFFNTPTQNQPPAKPLPTAPGTTMGPGGLVMDVPKQPSAPAPTPITRIPGDYQPPAPPASQPGRMPGVSQPPMQPVAGSPMPPSGGSSPGMTPGMVNPKPADGRVPGSQYGGPGQMTPNLPPTLPNSRPVSPPSDYTPPNYPIGMNLTGITGLAPKDMPAAPPQNPGVWSPTPTGGAPKLGATIPMPQGPGGQPATGIDPALLALLGGGPGVMGFPSMPSGGRQGPYGGPGNAMTNRGTSITAPLVGPSIPQPGQRFVSGYGPPMFPNSSGGFSAGETGGGYGIGGLGNLGGGLAGLLGGLGGMPQYQDPSQSRQNDAGSPQGSRQPTELSPTSGASGGATSKRQDGSVRDVTHDNNIQVVSGTDARGDFKVDPATGERVYSDGSRVPGNTGAAGTVGTGAGTVPPGTQATNAFDTKLGEANAANRARETELRALYDKMFGDSQGILGKRSNQDQLDIDRLAEQQRGRAKQHLAGSGLYNTTRFENLDRGITEDQMAAYRRLSDSRLAEELGLQNIPMAKAGMIERINEVPPDMQQLLLLLQSLGQGGGGIPRMTYAA